MTITHGNRPRSLRRALRAEEWPARTTLALRPRSVNSMTTRVASRRYWRLDSVRVTRLASCRAPAPRSARRRSRSRSSVARPCVRSASGRGSATDDGGPRRARAARGPTGPTEIGPSWTSPTATRSASTSTARSTGCATSASTRPRRSARTAGRGLRPEATTANASLVGGENVVLEIDASETDGYGRLLRYVWLAPDDDTHAERETWTPRQPRARAGRPGRGQRLPARHQVLAALRRGRVEARAAGRGIWNDE